MTENSQTNPPIEDGEAKKARLMGAMKLPDPPRLPGVTRSFGAQSAQPTTQAAETSAQVEETPKARPAKAQKAQSDQPNFTAMRRHAEKRDPVAGKKLADDEMIQLTHYLSARERREFKILSVINGHSMNEVIRHAVAEYIKLHRSKLPQ